MIPIPHERPNFDDQPVRRPLRVLVADDSAVVRASLLGLLGSRGFVVQVVDNGRAALEEMERHHYDVLLLDVQMPEMDGVTTARAVASGLPLGGRPRVIAMTAELDPETDALLLSSGTSDILRKPLRYSDLTVALGDLLLPRLGASAREDSARRFSIGAAQP